MILEVRREGKSHDPSIKASLSAVPQSTIAARRRSRYSLGSSGDKKGAAGRTKINSLSRTESSSMDWTKATGPRPLRDPISAYQDPYDAYDLLDYLGNGGEGACLLVRRKTDRELRVCKISKRSENGNEIPKEVMILRDILPPNDRIIKFYGLTVTPQTTQIYLDFYDGGDLSDFIQNYGINGAEIPESFIWHALLQLAEAVAFLHYGYDRHSLRPTQREWNKVIHRDIKPANILLHRPTINPHNRDYAYPSLVLADFGLATLNETSFLGGTLVWQPPETPEASRAGDCWAVGGVVHAMALDGNPPIDALPPGYTDNHRNRERWFRSRRSRKAWPISHQYTHELEHCMLGALTHDPRKRFNALEILAAAVQHYETTNTASEPLAHWVFDSP